MEPKWKLRLKKNITFMDIILLMVKDLQETQFGDKLIHYEIWNSRNSFTGIFTSF